MEQISSSLDKNEYSYLLVVVMALIWPLSKMIPSLAWSSVLLALNNIKEVGAVVDRPKALGDIRGVTYIYGMFYRFGLVDMPDKVNGKMKRAGRQM